MASLFHSLEITRIVDETPDAYTLFFLKPDSALFEYKSGQYLTLKVTIKGEVLRRAFSLSSSPLTDDYLSVTIKRLKDGRSSNFIRDNYKVGDHIDVLLPMGNFYLDLKSKNRKHYVFIAAGSGITPVMSMIKSVLAGEANSIVTLWYGNRNEEGIIFKQQLDLFQKQYEGRIQVVHSLSQSSENWPGRKGRLDKKNLEELLAGFSSEGSHTKEYFLCGPNDMIDAAEAALIKHAVASENIHKERYTAPQMSDDEVKKAYADLHNVSTEEGSGYELKDQPVTVILHGKEEKLQVKTEEYILDSVIEENLDAPYACQSGICTTCRAFLKSGVVSMDETEGLTEKEIKEGYVLTCQAHPLSENVILEFK